MHTHSQSTIMQKKPLWDTGNGDALAATTTMSSRTTATNKTSTPPQAKILQLRGYLYQPFDGKNG